MYIRRFLLICLLLFSFTTDSVAQGIVKTYAHVGSTYNGSPKNYNLPIPVFLFTDNCLYKGATTSSPLYNLKGKNRDGYLVYEMASSSNFRMYVSPDRSVCMEEVYYPSLGSVVVHYYQFVCDGGEEAQMYNDNQRQAKQARNEYDQQKKAHCTMCNGTGIDPFPHEGHRNLPHIGYTHNSDKKCKYCGKYGYHRHQKCARCSW